MIPGRLRSDLHQTLSRNILYCISLITYMSQLCNNDESNTFSQYWFHPNLRICHSWRESIEDELHSTKQKNGTL